MADISKCNGFACEIRDTCWRYNAPASTRQSYIAGMYILETRDCNDFIEDREKKDANIKRIDNRSNRREG